MHPGYEPTLKLFVNAQTSYIYLYFLHNVVLLYLYAGLTALRSDEVIDLMIKEYPTKHSEYSVILQEKERQRIAKEYSVRTPD